MYFKVFPRDNSSSLYVNDLVIYYAAANLNHIERKLKIAINKIRGWCTKNGYKLFNDKTTAVHFYRMRSIEYEPHLQVNNDNIRFKPVVTFLRLYLGKILRFKHHIEHIRQKTI